MIIFETERLFVRPLDFEKDAIPFFEMQGNPEVMRYTSSPAQTQEEAFAELKTVIDYYKKPDNDFWIWAIIRKTDDAFIGTSALVGDENEVGAHEIGYRLVQAHWGNGYGTEVMYSLIDYGFQKMNLTVLNGYVDVLNVASVKILEKSPLNFVREEWSEKYQCKDRIYRLERAQYFERL